MTRPKGRGLVVALASVPAWPLGPPVESSGTSDRDAGKTVGASPVAARPLGVAEPNSGVGEWRLCARETCHQPFQAAVGGPGPATVILRP